MNITRSKIKQEKEEVNVIPSWIYSRRVKMWEALWDEYAKKKVVWRFTLSKVETANSGNCFPSFPFRWKIRLLVSMGHLKAILSFSMSRDKFVFGNLIKYLLCSLKRYVSNSPVRMSSLVSSNLSGAKSSASRPFPKISIWPEKVFAFEATLCGFYFIRVVYNMSNLILCIRYYELS